MWMIGVSAHIMIYSILFAMMWTAFTRDFIFTVVINLGVVVTLMFFFSGMEIVSTIWILDEISSLMIGLTMLLVVLIMPFIQGKAKPVMSAVCMTQVLVVLFFLSNSPLFFYAFYELSLIPVAYIILSSGTNPEKVFAGFYMIFYTLILSTPLMIYCVKWSMNWGLIVEKFSLPLHSESSGGILLFSFVLLSFLVKAPCFMFHTWLPRAHVEAPLVGSMILAGILLKLGLYGMYRFVSAFLSSKFELMDFLFSLSLLGSAISAVLAISSDDLKKTVAYSSVSHMNLCLSCLVTLEKNSMSSSMLSILSHGICSPLLFMFVTWCYLSSNSRSLLVNKGTVSNFSGMKLLGMIVWCLNFCVPPTISFLGEMMVYYEIFLHSISSVLLIVSFAFFGGVLSIVNYSALTHSSEKNTSFMVMESEIKYELVGLFGLSVVVVTMMMT